MALYRKLNAAEIQHMNFLYHFLYVLQILASYIAQNVVTSHLYTALQATLKRFIRSTNKLRGLSPHANYTDRAAAVGRRS